MAGLADESPEAQFAGEVAKQLIAIRRRGLHRIDNRSKTEAPETELLAQDYCRAKALTLHGRIAQITRLIQDGLVAYGAQGNEYDRQLITSLFFDSLVTASTKGPTVVLERLLAESGKDEADFRNERHQLFGSFADFLVAFVTDAVHEAVPDDEPEDSPEPPLPPPDRNRLPLAWIGAAVAALVLIGGVIATVLLTQHNNGQAGRPTPSPISSPHPTSPPYVADKTYTEQVGGYGAPTFNNPFSLSVRGTPIKALDNVEVSCKVYAPTIQSASPDGYWYRLASSPYNDQYYAVANTFQNGDTIGGPVQHNTDFNVPDCPSS